VAADASKAKAMPTFKATADLQIKADAAAAKLAAGL
jgi:hypothetical protein